MQIWKSANICLGMKIIRGRFHIKTPFTFSDMHSWDMWQVSTQTFRNNRIRKRLAYFLRNLHTSWANISRILSIKKANFWEYCFYKNTNIQADFPVCISVPLKIQLTSLHTLPQLNSFQILRKKIYIFLATRKQWLWQVDCITTQIKSCNV